MFNLLDDLLEEREQLTELIDDDIPVLPLRGTVAFPFIILPLNIGVTRSLKLVNWAVKEGSLIALITSKNPEVDEPSPDQLYDIGVLARIHRVMRSDRDSSTQQIIVQGIERIKVDDWVEGGQFLRARVSLRPDAVSAAEEAEIEAYRRRIMELSENIIEHLPQVPNEVNEFLDQVEDPRIIVYTIASNMRMDFDDQLDI
jgi:ATP-dependent Lon protease